MNVHYVANKFSHIGIFFVYLLLTLAVASLAMSAFTTSWVFDYVGVPSVRLTALIALLFIASYGISKTKTPNSIFIATLTGIFALILLSTTAALPLGDQEQWIRQAQSPEVWLSEPFANVIQKITLSVTSDSRFLGYLAPLSGILVCVLFLSLNRYIGDKISGEKYLLPMFFFGLGSLFLYSIGIVENTILSSPFLVAFLYFGLRYLQFSSRKFDLVLASVSLAIATLIHGQNLFMLPALVLLPLIIENKNYIAFLKTSIAAFLTFLLTVAIGLLLLLVSEYTLSVGNATGGAAGGAFVPLSEAGFGQFDRFTMFSIEHFVEFGTIVLLSVPLSILLPLFYFPRFMKNNPFKNRLIVETKVVQFLGFCALCYLLFAFLWNFDLGSPRDLDLMISMSLPLAVFTFVKLREFLFEKTWLFVYLLIAQVIFTLVTLASLKTGYPVQQLFGL